MIDNNTGQNMIRLRGKYKISQETLAEKIYNRK
jgi:DNA-binding XRE family transcriptional regulator